MTVSSRTPDGLPNECPVCGAAVVIDPSQPSGDAPCPECGHLLWFTQTPAGSRVFEKEIVTSLADILERMGVSGKEFEDAVSSGDTWAAEIGQDSLDIVELAMELEEALGVGIPEDDLSQIHSVSDLIEYLQRKRRLEP